MIRVLLAEDDPATLALLEDWFTLREDTEVCGCARDGGRAVECVRRLQPDLLVLDLVMPVMSGLAVLRELELEPPPTRPKILVISRVNDDEIVTRAFALGASYYLLKPFSFSELPELISALFKGRPGRREEGLAGWLLGQMGASPAEAGYRCAALAAQTLAANEKMLLKEAYFTPIRVLNTSYECVEKNIRVLVRRLHAKNSAAYRAVMGGSPLSLPTNGRFLHALAEELKRKQG